jgi:hypothetical protein
VILNRPSGGCYEMLWKVLLSNYQRSINVLFRLVATGRG